MISASQALQQSPYPFEIKASGRDQINKEAWEAFLEMRAQAADAGVQDLSLEEINSEIQNARNER